MFFFFFQAEDGIRDADVTGVQTCALPIWSTAEPPAWQCWTRRQARSPPPRPAWSRPVRARPTSRRTRAALWLAHGWPTYPLITKVTKVRVVESTVPVISQQPSVGKLTPLA